MEKIAVFLDDNDLITTFLEGYKVKVYFKSKDKWAIDKEFLLEVTNLKSINSIREYFVNLGEILEDCRIVVTSKAIGIPYNVFLALDYSVWELQGNIEAHLDNILIKEFENTESMEDEESTPYYKEIANGHYFVDLTQLQKDNPELSSKKILKPILQELTYRKLDIKCCHMPPWIKKVVSKEIEINEEKIDNLNCVVHLIQK